jgi:hypothetical protein
MPVNERIVTKIRECGNELFLDEENLSGEDMVILVEEIKQKGNLINLRINMNKLGVRGSFLISSLTQLRELSIVGNAIGDKGFSYLVTKGNLISLNAVSNHITQLGLLSLNTIGTITFLDLSYNNIGNEGAEAIGKNPNLTSVTLSGCSIGIAGARALASNSSIKTLQLRGNDICGEGAKCFGYNSTLTELDLGKNGINDDGAKGLSWCINLTSLHLGGNKIGDVGVEWISKHKTLTVLTAGCNDIGNTGLIHLVSLPQLTELIIPNNWKITDEGIGVLSQHSRLLKLNISGIIKNIKAAEKNFSSNTSLIELNVGHGSTVLDKLVSINGNRMKKARDSFLRVQMMLMMGDVDNTWAKFPFEIRKNILSYCYLNPIPIFAKSLEQLCCCIDFLCNNSSTIISMISSHQNFKVVEKVDKLGKIRFSFVRYK